MDDMIDKFIFNIRSRKSGIYINIYNLARKLQNINIPPIRPIYTPLYYTRKMARHFFRFTIQKVYYEPMFKCMCKKCGNGLKIQIRIPLVSENLNMYVGNQVTIHGKNTFGSPSIFENPVLEIGDNTTVGYQVIINVGKNVKIGEKCLIADRVFIADNNAHPINPEKRINMLKVSPDEIRPVTIGNNVWIGYQAFIGPGVHIGDGSIIGANSSVVHDVPPMCIAAGSPAKIVREHIDQL